MSWAQFLKMHWEVLAATDFFTVEVATWHGLVTYYVLVVMELATRRVQIAGITPHPTAAFMQQCARQLTDPFDGFLLGKRYLIHDRDTKFTQAFDALLKDSGVEPIVLPPRSPNLNAHCERFVRSIKEEALERWSCWGNAHCIMRSNSIWPIIIPSVIIRVSTTSLSRRREAWVAVGHVVRRERLGGLLRYYYRDAA